MMKEISSVGEGSNENDMRHYSKLGQWDTFENRSETPWKFSNVGTAEGLIRLVGPIMWKKKECHTVSNMRGISYKQ